MTPFIGAGISLISGAIDNLFTGEGRARRQARRQDRRQKRAAKQAGRITVKEPAKRVPYYPTTKVKPTQEDIKPRKVPVGAWLTENWYFVAGGAAVVILLFWLLGRKKKKVGRPRRNPSKSSSGSSKSSSGSKSSKKSSSSFATRARRVSREWGKARAAGSKMGRKAAWAKWG